MSIDRPLFRVFQGFLLPLLAVDEQEAVREPDGEKILDAEQAAAKVSRSVDDVIAFWRETLREFGGTRGATERDGGYGGELVNLEPAARREAVFRRQAGSRFTDDQIEVLKAQAETSGLNLLSGECWATTVTDEETGEERPVLVAKLERLQKLVLASGLFNGSDPVLYRASGGDWTDRWDESDPPYEAKLTIYRKGIDRGHTVTSLFSENIRLIKDANGERVRPKHWREQPVFMLVKCLWAKALRQLFRDVMGNVYVPEELPTRAESKRAAIEARKQSGDRDVNDDPVPAFTPAFAPSEPATAVLEMDEAAPSSEDGARAIARQRGYPMNLFDRVLRQAKEEAAGDEDERMYEKVLVEVARLVRAMRGGR